ncbi:hypothetical protein LIPSTDRAFT_7462 [Lipomyces starkeyi NRRL Y-11557]|uniref:SWIM-type domain-containing protein n=1 Tax=Lipomyces starkeyi NRRL Y-11557 TaxID=675824 RepID=A0A1E3PTY4_LIPST|nr:hypothetical protein LIPSTDRAFT_7462 [Lipomyces starkeyi NRRL Y-11557]
MLAQLQTDHPDEAVNYFLTQWWVNGQCERWAEIHIRMHPNLGISTTSRVEGSHGAMKGALSSSSGNLHTAGSKINRKAKDRAEQLSILCSNENLRVRLEIRNKPETANLCTAISRSALDIVYAEVMKMRYNQEEEGTKDKCNCATSNRYLLPCSHQSVKQGELSGFKIICSVSLPFASCQGDPEVVDLLSREYMRFCLLEFRNTGHLDQILINLAWWKVLMLDMEIFAADGCRT